MIKVGKILEIREIFLIFFHFGWGFFLEHSEQLGALGALGALGLFGVGILGALGVLGALGFWRRWWGLGLGGGWR